MTNRPSSSNSVVVVLSLFSISNHVENDDSKGSNIIQLVNEALHDACNAESYLSNQQDGEVSAAAEEDASEVKAKIQKQVLRFLQVKDKYSAFGSMLMKSQAFHIIHSSNSSSDDAQHDGRRRPIVDLPRTQYKKPYIPSSNIVKEVSDDDEENMLYPLSVSHQYPFVGCARLVCPRRRDAAGAVVDDEDPEQQPPPSSFTPKIKIGIDIVTFDTYNKRLYNSEIEFINIFQDSFTKYEWERIISTTTSDNSMLHEFYIRWSMKEAYTKALGIGMGLPFNTFTMKTKLDNGEDTDAGVVGLWSKIMNKHSFKLSSRENGGIATIGKIIYDDDNCKANDDEKWEFYFLPLYDDEQKHTNEEKDESSSTAPRGCVCVCTGPILPSTQKEADVPSASASNTIQVEWTSLESLLEWHRVT